MNESEVPAVVSTSGSFSRTELESDSLGLRSQVAESAEVALQLPDAGLVAAALTALEGWAARVYLVGAGAESAAPGVPRLGEAHAGSSRDERTESDSPALTRTTEWVVYTSGTTGTPKPVTHTLGTLSRTVVASAGTAELTWGLLYDPTRMAGLQVVLQALRSDARLIAPPADVPLAERVDTLIDNDVTALSATPTLWRQILQVLHRDWPLRQITLGGEISDQVVLDALAARFPAARITHVFASTETGAAFSVKDGRQGFPRAFLDDPPGGISLQVRDDILYVHSPGVSAAGHDGWVSTGDVVEIEGDRVLFRGRSSGVVNVGGANVWPEEIETLLRSHPEVTEAVVWSVPNPLAGNLLTANVVPAPGADGPDLGRRLRKWVRSQVPNTHVPSKVRVVDHLDVSATGKIVR